MRKLGILLPLLAGFAAAPAYAQEERAITARAELRAGYDEVRGELTVQNSAFTNDFGVSNVALGVEVGVDGRISDGLQVGAYAGIDFSKVDDCVDQPFETIVAGRGDRVCMDADTNLTAGLRAGVPMGDGGLIYVKGGYSRGKFKGSYNRTATTQIFSDSDTVGGYHLGAGIELGLASNVYLKAEYVHHRYSDAFKDALTGTDKLDPHRHQLMAGVGFRF
ncbi:MAG TPA: porin family protein [Allosphingosinicella sp.]